MIVILHLANKTSLVSRCKYRDQIITNKEQFTF
ncbi:hypothetical protein HMPREF1212_00061 [Parabacteroides sp. HGS0025]|uniref:Uncharacterized protein n=1 Tax=Parabacteroides gordonii MS-1 = DSM 23371 TaxID=1203610 RepID=A0A0F5JFS3_9BACT|nr:hypothetical protein HMPREF1212_00061 [Parabacteroides sp. HGS0025]KKB56599.1 hypothetical protein HMPREF1536_02235 [Parabacteroides gordonii MS-1 = DSM 23371]